MTADTGLTLKGEDDSIIWVGGEVWVTVSYISSCTCISRCPINLVINQILIVLLLQHQSCDECKGEQ